MELKTDKKLDIERLEGDVAVNAGIDDSSLPYLFSIMSESLYSDAIGSIVREITSNCRDAHTEAKVEEPIIINLDFDVESDCWVIKFIDRGIGMSDKRLIQIYSNYFSSTKRYSNEQIGAFGLGSKTPLAYQDYFNIETVHEGIEYSCIFHKGENIPQLDSNYGMREEDVKEYLTDSEGNLTDEYEIVKKYYPIGRKTSKNNGTIISIDIKNNSDVVKFKTALKEQLCYFDEVVYSEFCDINNEYIIYDKELFKYRSDYQYSEFMHLCIDNVAYPINWDAIGYTRVKIPIALKLNIGDVPVPPHRESITYTDESKELIKNKIDEVLKFFINEIPNQIINCSNITDYISLMNEEDVFYNLPQIQEQGELFNKNNRILIPHSTINVRPNIYYKTLDFPIDISYVYSIINIIGVLSEDNITHYSGRIHNIIEDIQNGNINLFGVKDKNSISKYTNLKIEEEFPLSKNIIISRNKIKDIYDLLCKACNYTVARKRKNVFSKIFNNDLYTDYINNGPFYYTHYLGKHKRIKIILDFVRQELTGHIRSYSDYKADDIWISEYKQRVKEQSAAYIRKMNQEVLLYDSNGFGRTTAKLSNINKAKLIVYKIKGESTSIDQLRRFYENYRHYKFFDKYRSINDTTNYYIHFVTITKAQFKYIKNQLNIIHCETSYKYSMFRNFFKHAITVITLSEKQSSYYIEDISTVLKYSDYYRNEYRMIKRYMDSKFSDISLLLNSKEQISIACEELKIEPDHDILKRLDNILYYVNCCKDLKYLTSFAPDRIIKLLTTDIIKKHKLTKLKDTLYKL